MASTSTPAPAFVTTSDGVALALFRYPARVERGAVCLLTHAMMANSRYLDTVATHLSSLGVDCFTLDFRGHGRSVPPRPEDRRGWCFDDYVELDLPAAIAKVCAVAGIEPTQLCYLGHSLGGLVGLASFATGTVPLPRRLGLWATSVWLPGAGGSRIRKLLMRAYHLSAVPLGYAPIRAFKMGTDNEPRSYIEQLAGWAAGGRWTSRTGIDYLPMLRHIDSPVLGVIGAGDRLCGVRDARVLLDRLPTEATLRRVGRRFGDPVNPDHFELLTRPELSRLWTEAADFFKN